MPNYKDETQQYHIERIREVIAIKPRASLRTIREVLEGDPNEPLRLHIDYILKLLEKIRGERKYRFNQALVDKHLAEIQDQNESVITQMWRILLDNSRDERTRVAAAKVIVDANFKLFEAQLDAGIFERKLGTVDMKDAYKINPEQQASILRALHNYGIIKDPNPESTQLSKSKPNDVSR